MSRTAIKFGLFAAVCAVFTAWLAVAIGNVRLFADDYTLTASFDDVTGLIVDDSVKVAGVTVGKVTGIEVQQGRAVVTFRVDRGVRMPGDSTAAIRWRNLLGQRYLYLRPGSSATTLGEGDRVEHTISVVDLGELFNRLGPIIAAIDPADVNQFLDTIVAALDGNEDNVRQILADLAAFAGELGQRDAAIGRLVANLDTVTGTIAERDRQIRLVLDNLVEIARAFSDNAGIVEAAIDEIGPFSESLAALLSSNRDELDRTIAGLVTVLDVVESRLEPLDSVVGGLDVAAARIFAAGSYGEWLNQVIPCFEFGPPSGGPPPCEGAATGLGPASATPVRGRAVTGVDALAELLGVAG